MPSVLDGAGISVLISVPLTCLASLIEIRGRAIRRAREDERIFTPMDVKACITSAFFLFLAATICINAAATILAFYQVGKWNPEFTEDIDWWAYFIYAFAGVFLFQVLAANTNVFLFNKGIGTVQNWVDEARDPAVSAAVEKHVRLETRLRHEIVEDLKNLIDEAELDTKLRELLAAKAADRLESDARRSRDSKEYKLLWLARRYAHEAESMLEAKKSSTG
jgi:hypothetical protein